MNRKSPTRFPMSLRWSSYVASKPPKGAQKRKTAIFHLKWHFAWRKSATKLMVGATSSAWNFESKWPPWSEIADFFLSIFARSISAVTPSEKSSVNTNRKSTTRFPMSPRWTSYVVPNPQTVAQKRKVSKIWTISCDIPETVRERVSITINY